MKRFLSFFMAVVIFCGLFVTGAITVSAASSLTTSDACLKVLKAEEGFSKKPYWDYAQYTVGYGTKCPDDMLEYYKANGITEAEAEVLLRNHLGKIERDVNQLIDKYKLSLSQNQFDALIMFSYNCGTGWVYETNGTFHTAIAQGKTGNDIVRAFALWCVAGNEVKTFLLRRRLCEANMYLNGVYSQTPPADYCYVIYEPNGGTVSPRSQGYIAGQGIKPISVPVRSGYTFVGWYTDRFGGTKVETLDLAHKERTLYARWADASGATEEKYDVTVKVTGTDVNIRKGPGTNYSVVGTANKGQTMTITETASGSGYQWGKFGTDRWICLTYTNYSTAVIEQKPKPTTPPETEPTVPETTVPEPAVPETTVPETTVPETTVPETTVPETTVPPTTVPPTPSTPTTPAKVTGTVKGSDLRIRKGPSTGYGIVGYLNKGDKVEILEQKTVGTMVWGRISKGWISLDYVVLDKQTTTTPPASTVLCTGTITGNDLRIRSGAGTSYSIVGYLNKGDKVSITEKKTVGSTTWGKMAKGWISMDYVKVTATSTPSTPTTPTTPSTPTTPTTPSTPPATTALTGTVTGSDLRVRSGPGTSYSVKSYLNKGAKVTITERKTVGATTWGKISNGWISMDYVKLDSQSGSASTNAQTKTVIADCLLIRSGAGTGYKIVGYLYYGAKVTITETTTAGGRTWGKTSKGWICLQYVK